MNLTQIITYFLSTSVITAGLVYLAKIIIDKFVEARFEKFKHSLQKENETFTHNLNLEAEKFRHELNTTATEHQIKYAKLYEERGLVIKFIYNLLLELENALTNLTTTFQGPEWTTDTDRENRTTNVISQLRVQLEQNRIFFSTSLCDNIEDIILDAHKIKVDMYVVKKDQQNNDYSNKVGIFKTSEELLQPTQTWRELDQKVQKDIKTARLNLAQEFRTLIGVE